MCSCREAAEQGDARAYMALANMYLSGQGVPKDTAKGLYWMKKATEGDIIERLNLR